MFLRKPEKTSSLTMVTLKNGSEVPQVVVEATMRNLELLMKKNRLAFDELVQKCKNPNHEMFMFGSVKKNIEELELMSSGTVHDVVRDIVLSAVSGKLTLDSPVAEKSGFTKKI
jgi:hypothetical protein